MRRIKIKTNIIEGTIFAEAESTFIRLEADNEKAGFYMNGKPYDFRLTVHQHNDVPGFGMPWITVTSALTRIRNNRYSHILQTALKPQLEKLFSDEAFMELGRVKRLKDLIAINKQKIERAKEQIKHEKKEIEKYELFLKNPNTHKAYIAKGHNL